MVKCRQILAAIEIFERTLGIIKKVPDEAISVVMASSNQFDEQCMQIHKETFKFNQATANLKADISVEYLEHIAELNLITSVTSAATFSRHFFSAANFFLQTNWAELRGKTAV